MKSKVETEEEKQSAQGYLVILCWSPPFFFSLSLVVAMCPFDVFESSTLVNSRDIEGHDSLFPSKLEGEKRDERETRGDGRNNYTSSLNGVTDRKSVV